MGQGALTALLRRRISLVAGLLALAVYALTLAPDLTWAHNGADGGDLIASSFAGGVAHPPGYPLYALMGRVMASLPIGSIPYRYNLFSALAASGAVALVAWAAQESGALPALAAGLSLAFAPLFWSQAVIAEVYALSALLAAWIVALSVRTQPQPFILGCALAMGLTHHLTLAAFAPLALQAVFRWTREHGKCQVLIRAAIGFVTGLLPLAYLPLTAHASVGWGDASTVMGFWWLISAQLYRGYAFALPVAWIGPRLAEVARLLSGSFTWIGVVAGLWGLFALWGQDRWRGVSSLFAAMVLVIFAVGYNTADSEVYLIPALVVFAVWVGIGWSKLRSVFSSVHFSHGGGSAKLINGMVLALMLLPPAYTLLRNWPAQDLHADHAARDFVNAVMAEAPAQAIIVTAEDRHTFALWVGTLVEQRRPDLAIVDQDLLGYDWYRTRLKRSFPSLTVTDDVKSVNELAQLNPGRPVCRPAPTAPPGLSCEAR